jgi:hypothetical protein
VSFCTTAAAAAGVDEILVELEETDIGLPFIARRG